MTWSFTFASSKVNLRVQKTACAFTLSSREGECLASATSVYPRELVVLNTIKDVYK